MSQTSKIGQFEVLELLGEGGIGQVYCARDTALDRMVAIKSLRAELLSDKSFVDRFRGEAKNLALLSHPNITTLYTLYEEAGRLYMVMELVRGRTLEQILGERGAPFTMQEALAIVAQAADGLAYAHEMGIVHRDIKPANLILTNSGMLKIMDFGIARAQGSQRMTRDGSIVGTLAYMSPEQCRGQEVDGRTDQYSLAIVLYEMLVGKLPFEAATDYDLMQAHINTPPEWPSRLVQGIAPHAERALMKALSKKPADRFPSLTAFKDALGAPSSRTEAVSIVHKVTRLAGAATFQESMPAISAAVSSVTETVKKSQIPFALRGVAVGGGLALALAGALLYFLTPSPAPTPVANTNTPAPIKTSAPAAPVQPTQQQNPYLVDVRKPANPGLPPQATTDARQATPPGSVPTKPGPGSRLPFEVAAEPKSPGPAAADQPARSQTPNATAVAVAATSTPPADNATAAGARAASPAESVATADPNAAPSDTATYSVASSGDSGANPDAPQQKPAAPAGTQEARLPAEKEVQAAYETKDFARARELAEPCAKGGNPECQFIMGRLMHTGSAGSKDPGAAADWYRKAAEQGLAKARHNLGAMYYEGEGVPKDPRLAAEWFSKAAYQNYARSQFSLASLYEDGDGVPRNPTEARRWYKEIVDKSSDKDLVAEAQEALDRLGTGRRRRR